ncbi:CG34314, partial [Drosophila busckii]
ERATLFKDLTALLGGDILTRALRIVDEWYIIVYYTPDRLCRIVEFANRRNSAQVVRILPEVKYCKCACFQENVLQLRNREPRTEDRESDTVDCCSFVCEHILAAQLYLLLQNEPREQALTLEQFKYFRDDIFED